jgi:pyrroloquinoline quinone biosynthesis protein E
MSPQAERPRLGALVVEVTRRCDLACNHCYNVWKSGSEMPPELPTSELAALLDKALSECDTRQVALSGGEPTLRPDLEDLVALARRRAVSVTLITHGQGLDDSRITSLARAGVGLFELSLNGSTAARHDAAVGRPGSFARTTHAAALLGKHRLPLALAFVARSDTIDDWPATLELGMALGARRFLFNRYNPGGAGHLEPTTWMPSLAQLRSALEVADQMARRFRIGISAGVPIQPCLLDPREFPNVQFGYCAAGTDRAYPTLDASGYLRPCNHSPTRLGRLADATMGALLTSAAMQGFCSAMPSGCEPCSLAKVCQGGCKAAAEQCCGRPVLLDPFLTLGGGPKPMVKAWGE